MRDPARIDRIINKLRAAWKANPDLRLGQLIHNTVPTQYKADFFYLEDDQIEKCIDEAGWST